MQFRMVIHLFFQNSQINVLSFYTKKIKVSRNTAKDYRKENAHLKSLTRNVHIYHILE